MNSKRQKAYFLFIILMLLFWNFYFVIDSPAFLYSNPSTSPLWSYSMGKQYISAVSISSDGNYISASSETAVYDISMNANGKLFLFDNLNSTTKTPLWNASILNKFYSLAISANGSSIVAGGGYSERTVYLFNNSNHTPEWTYSANGWIYDVAISSDGDYIAAAAGDRYKAFLFKKANSLPIRDYSTTGLTLRVAISSNGSFMAVTDNAARLYFYNTSNNSPEWTYTLSGDMSVGLSISSDGNYIVSGGDQVYFFSRHSSTPLWTYDTSYRVRCVKISQDGNYIVAGSEFSDYKVYFFRSNNSIPEWTYSTRGDISSVAISYNGDYIAVLSNDQFVYLFNKSSSIPIWRYRLDGYPQSSYDFGLDISSDGKYIIVGGKHLIYLFDRDIINPPKLIIPGYNSIIMVLILGIITITSSLAVFHKFKKSLRKVNG